MELTPTQITNLRRQSGSIPYLSILHPAVLLDALIDGDFDRGARAIAYDTGTATGFVTVAAGQTLFVTTQYGQFQARVKGITGNNTTGSIELGENAIPWEDNAVITIVHNWELWTIPPSIRSGIQYKDYDGQYTDQGSKPTPICIMGGHRAKSIETGDTARQVRVSADDGLVTSTSQFVSGGTTVSFGQTSGITLNSWFRFQQILVPQGATINSASITFTSSASQSTTVALKISANDEDNPTAPTSVADYNARVLTTAQVDWDFSTAWATDEAVNTPSLTTVIQEIVSRSGWLAGNSVLLFVKNDGGTASRAVHGYDGSVAKSAVLNVTWTLYPTFNLDASQSYAVAKDQTIFSYLWSCEHNGGGTTGITIASPTSAQTTLTITETDEYWLTLTIVDTNAKVQNSHRFVNVHGDDNPPYTDFIIRAREGSWGTGGWRLSIEAYGDVTLEDFPDNSIAILYYKNYFDPGTDNEEGYVNLWGVEDNIRFAGYIRKDNSTSQPGFATGNVLFEITTPENLLENTTDFGTVSVNAVSRTRDGNGVINYGVPAQWYQYASWLTVGRAIAYYVKWQTTLLDVCDFFGLVDNILGVKNVNFTEPNTLARLNNLAYSRGIFAKVVSDRLGRLYLSTDIQYLNDAERAALDTVFTIGSTDITDYLGTPREPEDSVAGVLLDGFSWSFNGVATPYISIAPGYRESAKSYGFPAFRGTGTKPIKSQVLDSQDDSNEKAGRVFASLNNPYVEIRVTFAGDYTGAFDIPCFHIGWYEWGLSNDTNLRQLALNGAKLICRDIQAHDETDGSCTTDVFFEVEAIGPPGIVGNYPLIFPPTPPTDDPPFSPDYISLFVGSTDDGVFLKNWGSDFTTKNNGLTGNELNIRSLRIDPVNHDVWICHQDGLAYSVDLGNNWTEITKAELGEPVNTAGDTPDPSTDDLDQIDLWFGGGFIYLLRTQQAPDLRSWIYYTNGSEWLNEEILP